jgi:ABC-2 type transport system ATP-binding protein
VTLLTRYDLLGPILRQICPLLLTTQYLEETDSLSDNIVVIDGGCVIADGSPDDLKRRVGGGFCEVSPSTRGASDGSRWR